MATSGNTSITVTSYDTLKFSWNRTSYSVENNTSTISWSLDLIAGAYGYISSSASKDWSVTINGKTWSGTNTVGVANNATKNLASGSTTIPHNADGSKTFAYSFSQEFAITFSGAYIGTKSGSGSGVLTNIPRAATITYAPNFNDEQNPQITYINNAGSAATSLQACISLTGETADIPYRDIPKDSGTYTFELTDAEREVLRNATTGSNSRTVKFYVRTFLGSTRYLSAVSKTFTIINGTPTLSPTVEDTNSITVNLTGDKNKLVKYFSNASVSAGAAARKGATITSLKVTNGSKSILAGTGTINNVESGSFVFGVTDNRGNYVTQTVNKTLINYIKPTCNLEAEAPSTDGDMTFKITGNYFAGSFGAVTNSLIVQYRIKVNSEAYGDWVSFNGFTIDTTKNTYSATVNLSGLNYKNSYTIQAVAADLLDDVESAEVKVKTVPVFDWGEEDFNFNVPVSVLGVKQDYLEEEGESGIWHYRKWNSGRVELHGAYGITGLECNVAIGALYRTAVITVDNFPFTVNNPYLTASYETDGYGAFLWATDTTEPLEPPTYYLMRPVSGTIQAGKIVFNVIGTWK